MKAKVIVNRNFARGDVDEKIYGSFVEHMGRVVYGGIYDPKHPLSDENGFRMDVMKKAKEMGITCVRYPGGNFSSAHDWKESIGPVKERPTVLEPAWHSIETNEFGIPEFIKWADKAEVQPLFAVNLGTMGIQDALQLLEYCNLDTDTKFSKMRRRDGAAKPWGIRYWCLGNEMDGDWQIGHKDAEDYAKLARETGKAMKMVDPSIYLSVCGSSKSSMPSFPEWDATVLDQTYEVADFLALHQYYGGQELGTAEFLAQSMDLEDYIRGILGACDYIKAKKRSKKDIMLSFDEWGVWSMPDKVVKDQVDHQAWTKAPAFSEQIYTMEDSLLFASMLMSFIRHADRVKIACQSLLTNISAAIMTSHDGDCWVQPIYYPFAMMAKYGKGMVLLNHTTVPEYYDREQHAVPYLDHVEVFNSNANEIVAFLVNRSETDTISLDLDCENFEPTSVEHISMSHPDKKMTNEIDHDAVSPEKIDDTVFCASHVRATLQPLSFSMIRIACRPEV